MNWPLYVVVALLVMVVAYRVWIRMGVTHISVHEVKARLDARERLLIVDVREPHEFKAGHIKGAMNLPLGSLAQRATTLTPSAETILVCRSGNRSMTAFRQLKGLGFTRLLNMEGGMLRWPWEKV